MRSTTTTIAIAIAISGMAVSVPVAAQPAAGTEPAAKPATRATVTHMAPSTAPANQTIQLVAMVDNAWTEQALAVHYRPAASQSAFEHAPFERSSAGGYHAQIPATHVRRPGVEYYISGRGTGGVERLHFASATTPHRVSVQPSLSKRWQQAELARLHGYRSTVTIRGLGHNFGNRNSAKQDYFLRGEVEWTHHLLERIYSVSLGYGVIEGVTPGAAAGSTDMLKGARYGYGGARFRVNDSVSVDTRAYLGVDRDEFIVGVRGELTLGKAYRSSVNLGAEVLQNQGSSLWVRLQWDTVQPFLMGATVYKTDLPGAELSNGSYIVYDIAYPMTERLTLRASLSFGSRDGPGNFGGGLATTLAF